MYKYAFYTLKPKNIMLLMRHILGCATAPKKKMFCLFAPHASRPIISGPPGCAIELAPHVAIFLAFHHDIMAPKSGEKWRQFIRKVAKRGSVHCHPPASKWRDFWMKKICSYVVRIYSHANARIFIFTPQEMCQFSWQCVGNGAVVRKGARTPSSDIIVRFYILSQHLI